MFVAFFTSRVLRKRSQWFTPRDIFPITMRLNGPVAVKSVHRKLPKFIHVLKCLLTFEELASFATTLYSSLSSAFHLFFVCIYRSLFAVQQKKNRIVSIRRRGWLVFLRCPSSALVLLLLQFYFCSVPSLHLLQWRLSSMSLTSPTSS